MKNSTAMLVGFLTVAAAIVGGPARAQDVRPVLVPQQLGRYQIVISPHLAKHTFLLDTLTGQTWQLNVYSNLNGDPLAWEKMDRLDTNQDYQRMVQRYGLKPPQASAGPPAPAQASPVRK